jgi:hypothetical protein
LADVEIKSEHHSLMAGRPSPIEANSCFKLYDWNQAGCAKVPGMLLVGACTSKDFHIQHDIQSGQKN